MIKAKIFVLLLFVSLILPLTGNAGQYFSCTEMDYFSIEGKCSSNEHTQRKLSQQQNSSSESSDIGKHGFTKEEIETWAEPTVDESGKIVSKLPPLPVLKVLTNPNEQTAKEYIEWNQKRIDAIKNAQEIVKQVSGISIVQQEIDPKSIKSVEFYFSPSCPYCLKQAVVIENLAKTIGYQKIKGYIVSQPEKVGEFLKKTGLKVKVYIDVKKVAENRINAVPVTIIETADGKRERFDGYTAGFSVSSF